MFGCNFVVFLLKLLIMWKVLLLEFIIGVMWLMVLGKDLLGSVLVISVIGWLGCRVVSLCLGMLSVVFRCELLMMWKIGVLIWMKLLVLIECEVIILEIGVIIVV